jgi:DNA repair exonuclease SbcCD nuclease subunit
MPVDKERLAEMDMDYIALGHIHKPIFLKENIAYCGSLEGLDFGETGRRGFIRGYLGEKSRFEFIPFSTRSFHIHKISLRGSMTFNEIYKIALENIETAGTEEFHRIILSGAAPFDFDSDSLFHELEKTCYHIEIIDESYPDFDIKQLLDDHDDDIVGRFIRSFNEDELTSNIGVRALHLGLAALLAGGAANDH